MVHTIDERIKTLDSLLDDGSYTKQKCNLKRLKHSIAY